MIGRTFDDNFRFSDVSVRGALVVTSVRDFDIINDYLPFPSFLHHFHATMEDEKNGLVPY